MIILAYSCNGKYELLSDKKKMLDYFIHTWNAVHIWMYIQLRINMFGLFGDNDHETPSVMFVERARNRNATALLLCAVEGDTVLTRFGRHEKIFVKAGHYYCCMSVDKLTAFF